MSNKTFPTIKGVDHNNVKNVNVDDLIPYARNSRTHSPEQVIQIVSSIKEWGFTTPVLIDADNQIIAGHGRTMAAKKLGMETVPCLVASGWTEAQKKAYVIADNKLALNAGWDDEMLAVEFEELEELGFDLQLTGFDLDEVAGIIDPFADVEEAEFPDISDGDKEPFQQKTFTLHDEQIELLEDAITKAKTYPQYDTGLNENSNGNAIAFICDEWLKGVLNG